MEAGDTSLEELDECVVGEMPGDPLAPDQVVLVVGRAESLRYGSMNSVIGELCASGSPAVGSICD